MVSNPASRARALLPSLALALAALCSSACVERKLMIATVPAGADLFVDGQPVGKSPVTLPFTFYGPREIVARMPGYRVERREEVLEPPYFQQFPYDLYYETLTKDLYTDRREFHYLLAPVDESDTAESVVREKLLEAKELRER